MQIKSVNIQVNTDKSDGVDFVLIRPNAFAILEALQLVHRSAMLVDETPTSTTVIIVWEPGEAVPHGAGAGIHSGNGGTEVPQNEYAARPTVTPVPPLRAEEVPMFLREKRVDD